MTKFFYYLLFFFVSLQNFVASNKFSFLEDADDGASD